MVSRNPKLAEIRKTVLESAGFTVIPGNNDSAVEPACSNGIELIIIGHSVAPSDKRRVWARSRQCCDVPVMELHLGGKAELIERNLFAHESKGAHHLKKAVQKLHFEEEVSSLKYASRCNVGTQAVTSSQSWSGKAGRKVLHSWKEISNYTGRGIRTLQRYEVQFGFPVRRPSGRSRAAVLAFPDEIDEWLREAPKKSV